MAAAGISPALQHPEYPRVLCCSVSMCCSKSMLKFLKDNIKLWTGEPQDDVGSTFYLCLSRYCLQTNSGSKCLQSALGLLLCMGK